MAGELIVSERRERHILRRVSPVNGDICQLGIGSEHCVEQKRGGVWAHLRSYAFLWVHLHWRFHFAQSLKTSQV